MARSSTIARVREIISPTLSGEQAGPEASNEEHAYLYGMRGILTISSILWIFFQTFLPTLVTNETTGPLYQKVLRIVFSPILWNESLISSFFFVLSARSICVRFLKEPKGMTFAGSVIRRIIRLGLAAGIASGIASGIMKALGSEYVHDFKVALPNASITTPKLADDGLTAVNAMFDMFWVVRSYYYQAANKLWPSNTIWNVSLIYQQSWTIYFLMVILPFTRASWHKTFLLIFSIGSFWMCTWGWYDASALLLADYVTSSDLRPRLDESLKIKEDWKVPYSLPAAGMVLIGLAQKLCWAVFPQYVNKELLLHPFLDLSENETRASFAAADPYPRVDNWFIIFGLLLMIETTTQARNLLSSKLLVTIGKRSLSIFIAMSLVFWTAGIKLFLHLHTRLGTGVALSNFAVFVTCAAVTFVTAEVYYRTIDLGTQWLARETFAWLIR
ncbi:hypothetical protein EJ03DRAFT_387803 [Teratosphaeria nubilosa]|uniref:Acyltransferase 3 domain-containing protein n=1 Tax=Teratosphaeria nubilosa TaxID=161662 RepID=A0A6G1LHR1_9PEZI|nr:hypothetical protein EJ03DRAFT_387803 [Teratosphaeria nubilosa]